MNADSSAASDDEAAKQMDDTDSVPKLSEEETRPSSHKGLKDLKRLMEFYDKWVRPRWHWLRGNNIKDVSFRDLPLLFQPGELLYVPQDVQKIYRIMRVTDGRPKILHLFSEVSLAACRKSIVKPRLALTRYAKYLRTILVNHRVRRF